MLPLPLVLCALVALASVQAVPTAQIKPVVKGDGVCQKFISVCRGSCNAPLSKLSVVGSKYTCYVNPKTGKYTYSCKCGTKDITAQVLKNINFDISSQIVATATSTVTVPTTTVIVAPTTTVTTTTQNVPAVSTSTIWHHPTSYVPADIAYSMSTWVPAKRSAVPESAGELAKRAGIFPFKKTKHHTPTRKTKHVTATGTKHKSAHKSGKQVKPTKRPTTPVKPITGAVTKPATATATVTKYGTTVTSSYPIFTFTSTVVRTIYTSSTTTTAKGAVQTVDTYNQVHNGDFELFGIDKRRRSVEEPKPEAAAVEERGIEKRCPVFIYEWDDSNGPYVQSQNHYTGTHGVQANSENGYAMEIDQMYVKLIAGASYSYGCYHYGQFDNFYVTLTEPDTSETHTTSISASDFQASTWQPAAGTFTSPAGGMYMFTAGWTEITNGVYAATADACWIARIGYVP